MKKFVKQILNEAARVQRTIDPKIWASMSSMSSRLRSTLGEDAKPMKKDDAQVLLQKYVAGLLTMKVACPKNVSEIEDLKAYKLIGQAYINAGGTISDIQKLYVENGGTINPSDMQAVATVSDPVIDEPEEDEILDVEETDDNVIDNNPFTPGVPDQEEKKFDFNTATKEKISSSPVEDNRTTKPRAEITDIQKYINTYLKRNREILTAEAGNNLVYDEETGVFAIGNADENMPICAGRGYSNLDKKTRFFIINDTEFPIGNAGNNGVYDDFYFKRSVDTDGRLVVIPGSNYYQDEETKGKFYTQILSDNGMNAAMHVEDSINLVDITDATAVSVLKASAYLPTLPELVKIIDMLPAGIYWTSSVANDGTTNIALSVQPDKVLANASNAKLVTFIKFD